MSELKKDIDYYFNEEGLMVFTEAYLLKRGYCCQSGCLHCPYKYKDQVDPSVPAEFNDSWSEDYIEDESDSDSDDD